MRKPAQQCCICLQCQFTWLDHKEFDLQLWGLPLTLQYVKTASRVARLQVSFAIAHLPASTATPSPTHAASAFTLCGCVK